jgi:hypothetical protein
MKGKGIEVYQGIKILKGGNFKVRIEKSEFRTEKGDLIRGQGWFNLMERDDGRIEFDKYDTRNSPFHNMSTAPAHILLGPPWKDYSWSQEGESNYFFLKSQSRVVAVDRQLIVPAGEFSCLEIETEFEIPRAYTGPPYLKKRCWFALGVGLIRLEVEYQHKHQGEKDVAVLAKCRVAGEGYWPFVVGNRWVYDWVCQFGPNKFNIHNTGQEAKYKPPKP